MTHPTARENITDAAQLGESARRALRDLILTMADCKRLLGIRYSDRMLGAPTLESGIAASSLAQDEWGHGRLTYALLSDFGEDPKSLEHERAADEYRAFETLDRPLESWSEFIAAILVLDTALTVQYAAFADSLYQPIRGRIQKLLDEESFHFRYATSWGPRLAEAPSLRDEFAAAAGRLLPEALRWLGREEDGATRSLLEAGVVSDGPDALRAHLLGRIAPTFATAGFLDEVPLRESDGAWMYDGALEWEGWDPEIRRRTGGGLDDDTLARVRGDRNREFLVE